MTRLDADGEAVRPMPPPAGSYVEDLFRARYLEMVRLAGLLGADDPEDIAQEAFDSRGVPAITATGYDAAGNVVAHVTLGSAE
jgi:hypothetical protein